MLGHLSQWELQGGYGAVLTIPQLPSSSPNLYYHPLYCGSQISKHLPTHPPLLTADPHVQLAISSRISHRPMTLTTSKIKSITLPQIISLLPPHLRFTICLSPKPDTWGSRQAHINYQSASSLLGATFPTDLGPSQFSFIHLAN